MLSLKRMFKGSAPVPGLDAEGVSATPGRVLPRPLRILVRHFTRLTETAAPMPAGRGSILAVAFVGLFMAYGAKVGGQFQQLASASGMAVGFKVDRVSITGQKETSERAVLQALKSTGGSSLLGFSVRNAREQMLQLPWVQSVSIRKIYPDSLAVEIEEKTPFAVWQSNDELTVVQRNGAVIARFSGKDYLENRFAYLPRVVGEGAEFEAIEFLPLMAAYPILASKVKTYVRVSSRRWDVRFNNGIVARLPEFEISDALAELASLEQNRSVLTRQIKVVDLRFPDRIVFQLSEDAALKRREFVEKRNRAIKQVEKRI